MIDQDKSDRQFFERENNQKLNNHVQSFDAKPYPITAIQWALTNVSEIRDFLIGLNPSECSNEKAYRYGSTLSVFLGYTGCSGIDHAEIGDFIVKNHEGLYVIIRNKEFLRSFETGQFEYIATDYNVAARET